MYDVYNKTMIEDKSFFPDQYHVGTFEDLNDAVNAVDKQMKIDRKLGYNDEYMIKDRNLNAEYYLQNDEKSQYQIMGD